MVEKELIQRCQNGERKAQNTLWQQYSPKMLSICLRYLKHMETAEDILVQAFYRVYTKIHTYRFAGSFEGWIKRIVINECLMELRKSKSMFLTIELDQTNDVALEDYGDPLEYEELINLLDQMPTGYRTVFNLYVIEGFKHREIAEKLGVSINTSKSQLLLARRKMQGLIKKKYNTLKIA